MQGVELIVKLLVPLLAAVGEFISKVGFPIAAAVFLGLAIFFIVRWGTRAGDRLIEWATQTGDRLAARFEKHVDVLDERLDEIKPQLERIETSQKLVCRAPEVRHTQHSPA